MVIFFSSLALSFFSLLSVPFFFSFFLNEITMLLVPASELFNIDKQR
jgi:hypothetical protein